MEKVITGLCGKGEHAHSPPPHKGLYSYSLYYHLNALQHFLPVFVFIGVPILLLLPRAVEVLGNQGQVLHKHGAEGSSPHFRATRSWFLSPDLPALLLPEGHGGVLWLCPVHAAVTCRGRVLQLQEEPQLE